MWFLLPKKCNDPKNIKTYNALQSKTEKLSRRGSLRR